MKFSICAELAWRIQPFCSTEETRFFLHGFYVEPSYHIDNHGSLIKAGAIIIGTNGHILGVFYDKTGVCEAPGICKLNRYLKYACKPPIPTEFTGDRVLSVDGERAEVLEPFIMGNRATELVAAQKLPTFDDGSYPNWRHVVPRSFPESYQQSGCYNPKLLADIVKATGSRSIRVVSPDASSPAFVMTDNPDFVGVIMPLRGDDKLPEWFGRCLELQSKKPA